MRSNFLRITFWTIALIDLFSGIAYAEPMSAAMAMIYGSGIAAGGGILGGLLGKKSKGPSYEVVPDYTEVTAARGEWWKKLQEWEGQDGYGAIAPDWADIWKQAQDKVRTYYQGTITAPVGAYSKLKSQAAKSGMLGQPGYMRSVARLQAQEAKDYGTMAETEAIKKAEFSEQGRKDWLSSLSNLTSQRPQVVGGGNTSTNYNTGNMISDISSAIGGAFSNYATTQNTNQQNQIQRDWLERMYSRQYTPLS